MDNNNEDPKANANANREEEEASETPTNGATPVFLRRNLKTCQKPEEPKNQPDLGEQKAEETAEEDDPIIETDEDQLAATVAEVIMNTLNGLIEEDDAREEAATALLGGCLDMVCTYPEGYKPRQALYSCKTCFAQTGQLAGICYGCAENCHEGHELVEMYTKRNFCCDCGNSKFASKCKLYEEKQPLNARNQYNDNFNGIFCSCKNPYPPPAPAEGEEDNKEEDSVEQTEDMIQCPCCEDWFHPTHAISDPAERAKLDRDQNEQFDLICGGCLEKMPWLALYHQFEQSQQNSAENGAGNGEGCKLERMKQMEANNEEEEAKNSGEDKQSGLCLAVGWREQLCQCNRCKAMYEDLDCLYLLDREDTIDFYEQQGRARAAQRQQDKPAAEDAFVQREIIHHMNKGAALMQTHCAEFFAKRVAEKRRATDEVPLITKEDVDECFAELRVKQRRLMEETMAEKEKDGAWTQ